MYSLSILAVVAAAFSLMLTPLVRDWSLRVGLVDHPGGDRKIHAKAIPRTGGIPILASYLLAFAVLLLLPMSSSGLIYRQLFVILPMLPPVGVLFLTGLLDDWLNLKPWQKMLGQFAAATCAYWSGVHVSSILGYSLPPAGSFLVTIFWLILCSNAFNLIDGIDGLATGVGLTATVTSMIAGLLHGDIMLGLATAPLAGALLGFLRYNFNPASIFLGDSGSMLIGFLLGIFGVIWGQKSATMLGVAAPAMALSLPLMEVGLSVLRRFVRNQPVFAGDRGHIHHRLLDLGFTPRRAALLLYAFCGIGSALALLQTVVRYRFSGVVIVLFVAITGVGIRYLGYLEFEILPRFLWTGIRPIMSARVKIGLLERSLLTARSVQECWSVLQFATQSLGYGHIRARLGGTQFAEPKVPGRSGTSWQLRLKLPDGDYINITQSGGPSEVPALVAPFIDVVASVLPSALERIRTEAERLRQPQSRDAREAAQTPNATAPARAAGHTQDAVQRQPVPI